MCNFLSEPSFLYVIASVLVLLGCLWSFQPQGAAGASSQSGATTQAAQPLTVSSSYDDGKPIPPKYTADGANVSPPVRWSAMPDGVKEIVVIMDDPDAPAGTWDHWLLYKTPPGTTKLKEGISAKRSNVHPQSMLEGKNSWGNIGYEGPQPPRGQTHRYFLCVYGLDQTLGVKSGLSKKDLLKAMDGHVIAQGQLMGTYKAK